MDDFLGKYELPKKDPRNVRKSKINYHMRHKVVQKLLTPSPPEDQNQTFKKYISQILFKLFQSKENINTPNFSMKSGKY